MNKYSKNRLNHLEDSGLDNGKLAFEEAVMTWQELSIIERIKLVKISPDNISLILNIYRAYYNYNVDAVTK